MAGESWGRVAEDGTVFVRTKDGERAVGQWPDANPEEALAFYTRRYDALAFEVELLEQRVQAGTVSPDDARAAVKKVTSSIDEAQAVGDLDGLRTRLEALTPLVAQQREKRKAERAAKVEEARVRQDQDRHRGRDHRGRHRLAARRDPAARTARRVEGTPPARQVQRRRAVAPVLLRADDVHPASQAALRRAVLQA